MKRVVVLGSTGSIGTQTLEIASEFPDDLQIVGLAAHSNRDLLAEQAARFGVRHTSLFIDEGIEGLERLATLAEADIVVVSVAGVIGLRPTFAAIKAGKTIALASKEVLVAAGSVVMPLLAQHSRTMTPIDSEHSAIFQCVQGYTPDQIDSLVLTASGGPFRGKRRSDLESITVEQALNHPTWRMGGKITIDSATLMNKALEIIEATWLFGTPIDQVDAVIHPQSIVHSMVRLRDGSVLGQLGWPDMRLPIQYALLYPERRPNSLRPWNPIETPNLTFEPIDHETFPAIRIAKDAVRAGGTMPTVFNAANEAITNAFLRGECRFLDIFAAVEGAMASHDAVPATLESILETDQWARIWVSEYIARNRS